MMQYPNRRTVLRLRLTELTAAIVSLRLQRMNDGKAIGGLLGAIGRSAKPNEIERTVKVSVLQRRHSSNTPMAYGNRLRGYATRRRARRWSPIRGPVTPIVRWKSCRRLPA